MQIFLKYHLPYKVTDCYKIEHYDYEDIKSIYIYTKFSSKLGCEITL